MSQHTPPRRRCSFCGTSEEQAGRLQQGSGGATICDPCVVRLFAELDRQAFAAGSKPQGKPTTLHGGSDDA
ncbi:ClpX C4-type zinc finger protein [Corallococcus terminator]